MMCDCIVLEGGHLVQHHSDKRVSGRANPSFKRTDANMQSYTNIQCPCCVCVRVCVFEDECSLMIFIVIMTGLVVFLFFFD